MTGIKHFSALIFILFINTTVWANDFEIDYTPIAYEGNVSAHFFENNATSSSISFSEESEVSSLISLSTFELKEVFYSGSLYYNDPLSTYVNDLKHQILVNSPVLDDQIQIYISRFTSPNAAIWPNGTIILNIGLLELLDNESQLAFVIAHEIGHYIRKHAVKKLNFDNENVESDKRIERLLAKLEYEQQHEFEADSIALAILKRSKLLPHESVRLLSSLLHPVYDGQLDFLSALNVLNEKDYQEFECGSVLYNGFLAPVNSSNDQYTMHDLVKERIHRLDKEMSLVSNVGRSKNRIDDSSFLQVVHQARFEIVENAFNNANYFKALYHALNLRQIYHDNKYLATKISNCLYHIYLYQKNGILHRLFFDYKKIKTEDYASLCCFFQRISDEALKNLAFRTIDEEFAACPNCEDLLILKAKSTQLLHGGAASRRYYQKYKELYPLGRHFVFARQRLKQLEKP